MSQTECVSNTSKYTKPSTTDIKKCYLCNDLEIKECRVCEKKYYFIMSDRKCVGCWKTYKYMCVGCFESSLGMPKANQLLGYS